eukprot:gene34567-biopygen33491
MKQIPELMDPANECKCGRRCLSQFEYRLLQTYVRDKSKLDGRQFKENIIAELTRAYRSKSGSHKLEIQMFDSLMFLGEKVQNTQFRKYLREYLRVKHITMRKQKDCAGKCTTCEILTKQRRAVKDVHDLEDWKTLDDAHRSDYRNERARYNNTRADSSNPFGLSDSYCFDGAANNNTVCPHFPVKVKAMSDKAGGFSHLHLQWVVMHGNVLCMCLLMPRVPGKDVNMCLTTLNILLRYVVENTERHFRQTCHVQMDGGSENWNRHNFAFFCNLVHHGLYKEICLHRLPVGHSHIDLDGFFGLLKMLAW